MKLLEDKIKHEGIALNESVLKVDQFINHQVDPKLMVEIGKVIANHYRDSKITKLVTIESSGIAPTLTTALCMDIPFVILKKQTSKTLNQNVYQTAVTSFTKGTTYELTLSQDFITKDDTVLIVDDFLAHGEAASGAIKLMNMTGAHVAGVAILIEKAFQPGRQRLLDQGIDVFSLARISKMDSGFIEFTNADDVCE